MVRQGTTWTCGVSVTQSLLAYWQGADWREDALAPLLGADPENGTEPGAIAAFFVSQGCVCTCAVYAWGWVLLPQQDFVGCACAGVCLCPRVVPGWLWWL
jgi:hypothetical protein